MVLIRFLWLGLLLTFFSALAACGGGASNLPSYNPTPSPGVTATPDYPSHPSASGDTFAFAGIVTRNDLYAYPSPSPLPSTSTSIAVNQQVTVLATPNPFGSGEASDFQTTESDKYSSPTQTLSSTSDFYFQTSNAMLTLISYKTADDIGESRVVPYAKPQIVDEVPEISGATWTNSPAATLNQRFAGNQNAVRTINADGSYTDNETLYGTVTNYPSMTATLTENADGSGSFGILAYESGNPTYPPDTNIHENFIISAPTAQSSSTQFLTFSFQFYESSAITPSPQPAPTPTPAPFVIGTFPVWYSTAPFALYAETDTDKGVQAIPSTCNAPSAFGAQATELSQRTTSIDTIMGTKTTTSTRQFIVAGFGPVCVQVASTIVAYYDYNFDSISSSGFPIIYQGSVPLRTTTIAETLTLSKQGAYLQSAAPKAVKLSPIPPGEIALAQLHVANLVSLDRSKRLRAFAINLIKYAARRGAIK